MKNKILIIDNDVVYVTATALLFEQNGYDVICAHSGQEGFQKVKTESPDLIFLELMMSYETEGAEIAKALSQDAATKDIPIILVTAARKEMGFPFELKPDKDVLPVKAVVEKPVEPAILLKMAKGYITRNIEMHRKIIGELDSLAKKWKDKKGNLVMILHEIQNHYGYVPRDIAFELSRILDVPLARIYEVITFYNFFKLNPPGKHLISVCLGTACYLKGAPGILQEIKDFLHISEGQTTKDGMFYLQSVRCLGCCGLAPVMMIDDKTYGKVKRGDVIDILSKYSVAEEKTEASV